MTRFSLIIFTAALTAIAVLMTLLPRGPLAQTIPRPSNAYLGFDRDIYPGDAALVTLRKTFSFAGYWLSPPPNEKANTWFGKRELLRNLGFGFLILYRGRDSHELHNESDAAAKGALDAKTAATTAKKENFPDGTIIFLDVEEGGRLSAAYHAYLHAWTDILARNNYRAGVYCSGMPAQEPGGITILTADDIRNHAGPYEFAFFVYNDACPPSPGCSFPRKPPLPAVSGVSFADAWQFAQSPRRKAYSAHCPPGYHQNGNCYAPGDASYAWDLDAATASSADPSHGAQP